MVVIRNNKYSLIFKFLVVIFAVNADEWRRSICDDVKYTKPINDKPDLLIHQVNTYSYQNLSWTDWRTLCFLQKINSQAKSLNITYKNLFSVDYDFYNRTLYAVKKYSKSPSKIIEIKLDGGPSSELVFKNKYEIVDIAVDWITHNVYVLTQKEVEIVNLNRRKRVFLFSHDERTDEGAILIHPNKGYMFLIYSDRRIIGRRNLDGSDYLQLRSYNESIAIHSAAIDYHQNTLYWSLSSDYSSIKFSNFDGTNEVELSVAAAYKIDVDRNYVYYSLLSFDFTTIQRANKTDGSIDSNFKISNKYSHNTQTYVTKLQNLGKKKIVKKSHPCNVYNGGCTGLCLAVPSKNYPDYLLRICL